MRFYLKNEVDEKDQPPIELEVEESDRFEDIVSTGVSYWDLGDRGDYVLVKDGKKLDDTKLITNTDVKEEDTLLLVKKGDSRFISDEIAEKLKSWIEEEIGVRKDLLVVKNRKVIDANKQVYILSDTRGHQFEISTKNGEVQQYKPVSTD